MKGKNKIMIYGPKHDGKYIIELVRITDAGGKVLAASAGAQG